MAKPQTAMGLTFASCQWPTAKNARLAGLPGHAIETPGRRPRNGIRLTRSRIVPPPVNAYRKKVPQRPTAHADKSPRAESNLVVRPQPGRKLSREQQRFNTLLDRVPELEQAIAAERARLERLLAHYQDILAPLHRKMAERQIALAHAVSTAAAELKLPERRKAPVRRMILDLCDVADAYVTFDEPTLALYADWLDPDLARRRKESKKRSATEQWEEPAAPEEDPIDLEEIFARVRREFGMEDPADRYGSPTGSDRKEELTRKSVRSVYLSLAKVLHPDAVTDPEEKSVREAFMKKAALAYHDGDLVTLLKLELQWVTSGAASHSAASAAAVRVYLPALRQQVAELEHQLRSQFDDDRFYPIRVLSGLSEKAAFAAITKDAKSVKAWIKSLEQLRRDVLACRSRDDLLAVAGEYGVWTREN
jgi:hypothetical protein